MELLAAGLDLAGSPANPSGYCLLDASSLRLLWVGLLYSDSQILEKILEHDPKLVAIDAPLGLPKGRCCLDRSCSCASFGSFRKADLELRKLGIKFFPITLGPMRKLTLRGIELKRMLESRGYESIEVFPGGAQDLLGIPRASKDPRGLQHGLIGLGLRGEIQNRDLSRDELDAVTCAYIAKLYLDGNYLPLGDPQEALIIMPMP